MVHGYSQACNNIFSLRELSSRTCSAAGSAVCFEVRVAGLDATETRNELSQPKFQFTGLDIAYNLLIRSGCLFGHI